MKIKNYILLFFILNFYHSIFGQILVSDSITLISSDGNKRQIENLGQPVNLGNALDAYSYYHNYLLMGIPQISADTVYLNFPIKFTKYYTGMQIYFPNPVNNNGNLYVNCDSLGVRELKIYGRSLNKNELITGRIVSLIYNGAFFEIQNEINSPCPDGFIIGNKNYCIEINERDSLDFYSATVVCGDLNSRLCTWSEWKYACSNIPGINDLVGNFEWIDDAGNYTGGYICAKVIGGASCSDNSSQNTNIVNKRKFRCCYSR